MTARHVRLSVNIDHVATLRQVRGVGYPDPVEAAAIAEAAGASGITAHLRMDRRHVQERDLERLRERVQGKLNLEMASDREMVAIAVRIKPDQVTLVPERAGEVTTEGGLNLEGVGLERARRAAIELGAAGISVSLFLDPDPLQIEQLASLDDGEIPGFEINTDAYTRTAAASRRAELDKVRMAAMLGEEQGLHVYAGHGLTTENVGAIAALPQVEELNIGHSIVSRAVLIGMEAAVREMIGAMAARAAVA
ncbi:MAG TPA: pyridoxine 5'-phosphate synthase [Thermoanaerobaculia bacterium]|jgi:pyridoxine 5-phosphate synthase|nr:pyridoxine 5'-phosphate synthase [Thermoanaerobaculia bacterium]